MIHQILIALDDDTDTPVATRYAAEIAQRFDAQITGVAVVDMGSIATSAKGGGIGAIYMMDKVEAALTASARAVARRLLDEFRAAMADAGVQYEAFVQEGVPVERIVEDMNYCDLLVIGKEPHFYYSHPAATSMTLEQVFKHIVGPVLLVPDRYREIRRVLVAFDGSPQCVRSLRAFLYLKPFGTDVAVDIVNIHGRGEREGSQLVLRQAQGYVQKHGFHADFHSIASADRDEEISGVAERFGADLVVAGAHVVSKLARLFGSTTASLLAKATVPLWLEN